ncbi:MAG: hypothetical protein HKN42_08495 [Granulosicoccus sp.]|nr:hypothetical protein [Granulosicoccus sp.]
MSALVFRLRNVPEDEADDVRALLDEQGIHWYETTAGNWSIAMPGLWVSNEDDLPKARALIDAYQRERSLNKRREYQDGLRRGDTATLWQRVRSQPLQVTGIVVFCLFILYAMISPFLRLTD